MNVPKAGRWILAGLAALPLAASADVVEYLHTDLQGSVVAVTDESGAIIERRVYEPYGLPTAPIDDGPGYTGHVMDGETRLVYMQQRYYDQEIGRFLSVDPAGVSPAMGSNFNRYWYANNNPYRFVDPDGLQACPIGQQPCTGKEQPPKRENRASAQSRWDRANLHRQTFSDVPSGGWTSATFIAATTVNAAGLSTTARELSIARNGLWYSNNLERWYSVSKFYGNQYTERQRDVLARADKLRAAGQGLFVIAAGLSIYQGISSFSNGDLYGTAHAGVDIAWGTASTFGGPIGLAGGAGYFGTSMLIQVPMVRDITVKPLTDTFCSSSGNC